MSISLNVYVGPVLVINLEPVEKQITVEGCCQKCDGLKHGLISNARDHTSKTKKFCPACGSRLVDFETYVKEVPEVDCGKLFCWRLMLAGTGESSGWDGEGKDLGGKTILIPNVKFSGGYHVPDISSVHTPRHPDLAHGEFQTTFAKEIETAEKTFQPHNVEIEYAAVNWWS